MSPVTRRPNSAVTHHRARVANAALRGDADAVEAARLDLRSAKAEQYIRRLVDEAPPLSELQRARLAALLLGARRDEAASAA